MSSCLHKESMSIHDYGRWLETIEIDGVVYHADRAEAKYAERAGLDEILAINGLPPRFEENIVIAAQVCDVPHTWRIHECQSVDEVTPEIIEQGKQKLNRDRLELNAHIITYLNRSPSGALTFLAAGAIRNKLSRKFENEEFPVVSRSIVVPELRDKGIGSFVVVHRFGAVFRYFKKPPMAIHFGTDSPKILQAIKRVEEEASIRFVHIGDEQYTTADGTHTVHDFLCFLPAYREALAVACERLAQLSSRPDSALALKNRLAQFAEQGVAAIKGSDLERLYVEAKNNLKAELAPHTGFERLDEFFEVKKEIGAEDPKE